jgi:hypothetical protein
MQTGQCTNTKKCTKTKKAVLLLTISQEESCTLSTRQAQLVARTGQAHSLELKGRDGTSCRRTHKAQGGSSRSTSWSGACRMRQDIAFRQV